MSETNDQAAPDPEEMAEEEGGSGIPMTASETGDDEDDDLDDDADDSDEDAPEGEAAEADEA